MTRSGQDACLHPRPLISPDWHRTFPSDRECADVSYGNEKICDMWDVGYEGVFLGQRWYAGAVCGKPRMHVLDDALRVLKGGGIESTSCGADIEG